MKILKKTALFSAITFLGLVACKENTEKETAKIKENPGINLKFMDNKTKPNDDFFRYVNGTWLDTNKIPDDRTVWGSFNELRKKTDADALAILKAAMSNNKDLEKIEVSPGSDQDKAVKLFQTIMDTVSRNKQGINPIKPYLSKINNINNIDDLQAYLIEMEPKGGGGFFGFRVGPHPKDSNKNAAYLSSGRLGLPDRDYYVKDDENSKETREKYIAHITKMLQFLGENKNDAKAEAKQILEFETRLATPKMDKVDRRDARKRYNPRSISDLQDMVPSINWKNYFSKIGIKQLDTVIVSEVKYMDALQSILAENSIADWKAYLRWTQFRSASGLLSTELEKENWNFYSKELRGALAQMPRDESALQTINRNVGEALGKLYVDRNFSPEAKAKAKKMIDNVILAFKNRILNVEWMTNETKQKAVEKLLALKVKIAYPDQWKDYSSLDIKGVSDGGTYLDNMINHSKWSHEKELKDLGNPVDKSRWHMSPQTVNAYFNPPFNEIVFPAAILQPPFYNFTADDAVNYGGIGAVIGHEISHCFDDSGSRYDKDGNLNNWWTEEDGKQFKRLGKDLAEQYSALEVLPGVFINGAFTLGENIGDLGGVNVAYDALQLNFKDNGKPKDIDGFTAEQRFFMSWTTVWRTKMRDNALKTRIKTDPHSPGMNRAVQPLLNIDDFYKAFNIKEGDSMYIKPENRVKIW